MNQYTYFWPLIKKHVNLEFNLLSKNRCVKHTGTHMLSVAVKTGNEDIQVWIKIFEKNLIEENSI